jgi:peptide methionine sulfoxide reductase MsrA
MTTNTERAVLAGGCFWGMQDLIRRKPGVISTRAAIQAARSSTAIMPATARADIGASYRSAKFYTSPEQRRSPATPSPTSRPVAP